MNRKQAKLVRDLQPVLMNGEEIADHHPRSGHRATPRRSDPSASHAVRHGPEDRCVRQETGGYELTDFTYRLVTSIQHKKGIITREIVVHGSGLSMEVRNIWRAEIEAVVQAMGDWLVFSRAHKQERPVTRDRAILITVEALVAWHRARHGLRCICLEGEQFGHQAAAVVDALIAGGAVFDSYGGPGPERL